MDHEHIKMRQWEGIVDHQWLQGIVVVDHQRLEGLAVMEDCQRLEEEVTREKGREERGGKRVETRCKERGSGRERDNHELNHST